MGSGPWVPPLHRSMPTGEVIAWLEAERARLRDKRDGLSDQPADRAMRHAITEWLSWCDDELIRLRARSDGEDNL